MNNLPIIKQLELKKLKDPRKSVIFNSPSADKVSQGYFGRINCVQKIHIDSTNRTGVDRLILNKKDVDVIYAVGAGRVMDIARLIAKEWGLEVYCIPTAISSDAFLVDSTGLREDGCVTYVPSKRADEVLIDWELLQKTPLRYHLSGCGDILSIHTALNDWKFANTEKIARSDELYLPYVAKIAEGILDGLLAQSEAIARGSKNGLESILVCLAMEVMLCNLYGNSRPEEGGEHFFAYCIENKMAQFLHGEMVGFGVLVTSMIQGQDWRRIKSFMDSINFNYAPDGLTRSLVVETLSELPEYVNKHKLRISVYNDFDYGVKEKEVDRFLDQIGVD